jgi:hypothetical protein
MPPTAYEWLPQAPRIDNYKQELKLIASKKMISV